MSDDWEASRFGVVRREGGEELVVLAHHPEGKIGDLGGPRCDRNGLRIDDEPDAGPLGDPSGIPEDSVREIDQSVGGPCQPPALLEPEGRTELALHELVEAR